MEAVKCQHWEQVTSTPVTPGIELGTCSKCGQIIQYDHNKMMTTETVTKLGRLDGNIVLPKAGLRLLLSAVDREALDAVSGAAAGEPAPEPRKGEKREAREQYWEQHKEAIIEDYYIMNLLALFRKWGLASNGWKELKEKWTVASKGHVNRYTGGKKRPEPSQETRPAAEPGKALPPLPSFPQFNEEWTPAVKIEWFKTYKELRLDSGEK